MQVFPIGEFPSYQDWSGYTSSGNERSTIDNFPLRSELGTYLRERFQGLSKTLIRLNKLEVIKDSVTGLDYEKELFTIKTENNKTYTAHEVLLTIGHQPTEADEQLAAWKTKVQDAEKRCLLTEPYPVADIKNKASKGDVVAFRGFGLAMIDAARSLTVGNGGSFELLDKTTRKMRFIPSEKNKVKLVPFSLDGLPMTPKPLSLEFDTPFIPSKKELTAFKKQLQGEIDKNEKPKNTRFLINVITPLIVKKFLALQEKSYPHQLTDIALEKLVKHWLEDASTSNDLIVSKKISAYKSMQAFVDMAAGNSKISLDYCLGQVWRHCQPTMYKVLSFSDLDDEVIAEIIKLDERLKRYSYGPPVDSLTQLLALVDAGVMTLDFVNDPDINLSENGWEFKKDDSSITATIMANTIVDSPKILKVNSPLVQSLLNDSLVEPVHSSLGISTYENAIVQLDGKGEIIPLAILGRLAKGTVVGVDSILECFGARSDKWAKGVVERLN